MTKALALARAFHAAGPPGGAGRVGELPAHRAPLLAGGRRVPRGAGPGAPGYAEALLRRRASPRASTSTCRSAARRPAGTTRGPSRCSPSSARCCTPTPRCCASSTTRTRSPRPPTTLGLPVPETHRITDGRAGRATSTSSATPGPVDPQEHPLRPGRAARPHAPPAPDGGGDRGVRPVAADLRRTRPGSCRSSSRGGSTAPTAPCATAACRSAACCESSAFQLNYAMVDKPEIEEWVRRFVGALRRHRAGVVRLHRGRRRAPRRARVQPADPLGDHDVPRRRRASPGPTSTTGPRREPADAPSDSRPTYWLYHELWRCSRRPSTALERLDVIRRGTDAVFDRDDPLPFLLLHHLQIPSLLLRNLVAGTAVDPGRRQHRQARRAGGGLT